MLSLKTIYNYTVYPLAAIGAAASAAWSFTDNYSTQTITARLEKVEKRCRDEMKSQAKVQNCSGIITTDKKLIDVTWKTGWNECKDLKPGETYAFPVRGLGHTARPSLNGKPVLLPG